MARTSGLALPLVAVTLFLVFAGPGAAKLKGLAGSVGPGFTISVALGDTSATRLEPGRTAWSSETARRSTIST
jgi:hypothetical protein